MMNTSEAVKTLGNKNKQEIFYVYGAREIESGKLVSDITSPGKKFWQQEKACKQAIAKHNAGRSCSYHSKLELVKFRLIEEE